LALFEERNIAKLAPGCASRILSAHASADKPLRQEFEVRLDFVAELALRFSLTEQPAQLRYKSKNQGGHDGF
jgi:hypothetical protein